MHEASTPAGQRSDGTRVVGWNRAEPRHDDLLPRLAPRGLTTRQCGALVCAPGRGEAARGARASATGQHPGDPGARFLVRYSRRPSNSLRAPVGLLLLPLRPQADEVKERAPSGAGRVPSRMARESSTGGLPPWGGESPAPPHLRPSRAVPGGSRSRSLSCRRYSAQSVPRRQRQSASGSYSDRPARSA